MHELPRIPLHDVHVHAVDMEQTLQRIGGFICEGGAHQIVTLDASMCVMAARDEELRRIILAADLVTPDSSGVLWACRRKGHTLSERVSGVEIVERLCAESRHRLYFFGAAPGVAEEAAQRMRARYPGCVIVGARSGFFHADEEPCIVDQIRSAAPDVLCVALGIPKQEKWIAQHSAALGVPVSIGVGGTLDVLSGRVKRAPLWMQRANLEWLYRLYRNPRKIGKALTLPRFVLRTLRSRS